MTCYDASTDRGFLLFSKLIQPAAVQRMGGNADSTDNRPQLHLDAAAAMWLMGQQEQRDHFSKPGQCLLPRHRHNAILLLCDHSESLLCVSPSASESARKNGRFVPAQEK